MCLLKKTKNPKGKILCRFIPKNINGVPESKKAEYLNNLEKFDTGYWEELVTPDKHGYFKNLNGQYFIADNTLKQPLWYKENPPVPVVRSK